MTDELPPGWAEAGLRSVVTKLVDGSHNPPARIEAGWPMLSAQNVSNDRISFEGARLIAAADFERESNRTRVTSGDVLLTIVGSIGRTAVVPEGLPPFTLQRSVAVMTPQGIEPRFLSHQFREHKARRYFEANARGTAQKGIYLNALGEMPIRVAPKHEQQRIVSKLDELFSRIDEGERALERVQKLVERYRQSVLKAAVTGELTRDWREKNKDNIESGEALLARILKARREAWEKAELDKMKAKGITPTNDKWKQKYEEPAGPSTDGLQSLPDGWIWASVAQIGSTFTGKTPPTSQEGLFGGDLPFIKPTDLDQGYDVRNCRQTLTEKGADFCDILPANSILVTCIGATIGKVGLARVQCATNQQINSLVVAHSVFDPRFVYWLFASPHGQQQVIGNSSSTTLPILNKSRFEALPMPVPSLAEQAQIVDLIELRLNAASHLVQDANIEDRRASALRQVVLRSAFAGSLVPQDVDDEPASALLERIVTERSESPAKPKRGRKPKTQGPA